LENAEPLFKFRPLDGVRPTSVWQLAQPGSKICDWIWVNVGAVLVGVAAVGLLLPHAAAVKPANTALNIKPILTVLLDIFTIFSPRWTGRTRASVATKQDAYPTGGAEDRSEIAAGAWRAYRTGK
jgi:hypothetical protein